MRVFIALPLSDALRQEIGDWTAEARDALPPARWVRPENLHVTVVFLGELPGNEIDDLRSALRGSLAGASAFELVTAQAGTFPPVAWLGFSAENVMTALHATVVDAVGDLLPQPETRAFHPHVTLARPRRPWKRDAIERFVSSASGLTGRRMAVDEIVLLRSRLLPEGAQYSILDTYELDVD